MHHIARKLLTRSKVGLSASVSLRSVALVMVASVMWSCGDGGPTQTRKSAATGTRAADASGLDLVDANDAVIDGATAAPPSAPSPTATSVTRTNAPAVPPKAVTTAPVKKNAGRWAVMVATFSDADHVGTANAFRRQLINDYPELRDASVRRVGKGSAIVMGRFGAPDDSAAQAELKHVKSIDRNGRRPFASAMLLRTSTDEASAAPKPHDLRTLRAKFPNVRPLFSLQVAAWSTFGEKGVEYEPMRAAAEKYCAELRTKGHEAWFLHDDDCDTSIVAVGHFDRRAYDTKSTLFSPEIEDLMRVFPANQVNGEPLAIPIDPRDPKGKTRPQPCRLVEVPGL